MRINGLPSDPRYRVSDDGTVYGLNGQVLKPWIENGYKRLKLAGGRKRYVHDLVLETFVGPKPSGACVRHGRLGSLNNSTENICYGTYSENNYDLVADGIHGQASKTHCANGHEFTSENTRIYTKRGWCERQCRACGLENSRAYKARMKTWVA